MHVADAAPLQNCVLIMSWAHPPASQSGKSRPGEISSAQAVESWWYTAAPSMQLPQHAACTALRHAAELGGTRRRRAPAVCAALGARSHLAP